MIALIVAKAADNAIGRNNGLIWHISEDLKYFKRLTTGHPVVMGRLTYESMGGKGLPNRINLVVTRNAAQVKAETDRDVRFFTSLEAALAEAVRLDDTVFIIGGGSIYRQAMEQGLADRLYVTEVDLQVPDADTYFPEIDPGKWILQDTGESRRDEKSGLAYRFTEYRRHR